MDGYAPAQQADGKIRLALDRLADRYAFHVALLQQFTIQPRPEVGTMGVALGANGKLLLLHNPEFILATRFDELTGVLLHEVHHVLFHHLATDRTDFPDEWARTVAEEVTCNEFIFESLPEGAITLAQFPALPSGESTAQRYQRLCKVKRRFPIQSPQAAPLDSGRPGGRPAKAAGASGKGPAPTGARTVDDHSVWGEALPNPEAHLAAVRDAVQQAVLEAGTDQLPEALQAAVAGLGVGTATGTEQYLLQGGQSGTLDWRRLLRQYVGQLPERRRVFHRPPRRLPRLVGVVAARGRRAARVQTLVVIDTSGSISDVILELIDGELRRLAAHHAVTVVECDAAIHAVYRYRPVKTVSGRGGTDFRPPLAPDFLRKHRADLVIYFTDGHGPAPDRPPGVPVIWCLVPGGVPPATWGRVISMGR